MPADDGLRDHFQIERANGLQDFEFFVAHGGGVEGGGRLDGDERSELQDVALNHVAKCAGGFVKAAAALDAEGFRGGDLHVVHVVAVPQRLENAVAEAQDQQVLDGIFAEIVVDAVDLLLFEDVEDDLVQFFGGGKVAAKGLFDDDARPGIRIRGLARPARPICSTMSG